MFVAIEGCIASGKSSSAALVADELGLALVAERTSDHPFLAAFYKDPRRFAFETELAFALLHYHQLHQIEGLDLVSDFSVTKDIVFAEMNLQGEELSMFLSLHTMLAGRLHRPDLVVFLDLPVAECQRRCIARGRPYELTIPLTYFQRLRDQYERRMADLGMDVSVLRIDPGMTRMEVAGLVIGIVRSAQYH